MARMPVRVRGGFHRKRRFALLLCLSAPLWISLVVVLQESLATPEIPFTWIYAALVGAEALFVVSVAAILISAFDIRFLWLKRRVRLRSPFKVLALLVTMTGLFVFAFWAAVDIMSGYNSFPSFALSSHWYLEMIYRDSGLQALALPDKNRLIGFIGFCFAEGGFISLRLGRGIGTAVRQGVLFFAAPTVFCFELALLYYAPLEMYWHVVAFAPWSLGRYITPDQFLTATNEYYTFAWAGNVYLLSNWFVLLAAGGLLGVGIESSMRPVVDLRNLHWKTVVKRQSLRWSWTIKKEKKDCPFRTSF
jgi:hypothetical protein